MSSVIKNEIANLSRLFDFVDSDVLNASTTIYAR